MLEQYSGQVVTGSGVLAVEVITTFSIKPFVLSLNDFNHL